MAIQKAQFKSGYLARVQLVPKGGTAITLDVSGNKTLPGFTDGETWTFTTDNPDQEIAETIAGKLGGINVLSYEVPYDPNLMKQLVGLSDLPITIQVLYDDEALDMVYQINVKKCFLINPGESGGTANNSAPTMTIKLQPRGGGKIADCIEVEEATRD